MSLIMNGVDIPKNCLLCPCCVGEGTGMGRQHYCQAIDDEPYVSENHRPDNCPIPEISKPHGRLIDADMLLRKCQKISTQAWKMKLHADVEITMNQFIDFVKQAPTVIEAEK